MKQITYILVGLFVLLIASCTIEPKEKTGIEKFTSEADLIQFLRDNQGYYGYYGFGMRQTAMLETAVAEAAPAADTAKAGAEDYSTTNIQVEGVDEADIVKNDGKYIYVVSGKKIIIVDAYPAEDAEILSEIELEANPSEIFINEDKLIVIGHAYNREIFAAEEIMPYPRSTTEAFINVYDISDRSDPELEKEFSVEGDYYDSRMIGDYVYIIANQYVYYRDGPVPLPRIAYQGVLEEIPATDIYYFPIPDSSYQYTPIISINTQEEEEPTTKVFLTGYSQNMYVSQNSIYLTNTKRLSPIYYWEKMVEKVILPVYPLSVSSEINQILDSDKPMFEKQSEIQKVMETYYNKLDSEDEKRSLEEKMQERMEDLQKELAKETEKTVIHKISIEDGEIEYQTQGEAPGHVLNQFSMDEYNSNFRIATTTGSVSRWGGQATSLNHIYVLDEDLDIIGSVEDLAPGERIYSARFIADRAYLVTFRKVDPLFVIDLENPYNPKVLGKLKIPGYSDYLHPYDENHLIGIGKGAVAAEQGDFAWYQGVKISLFDVSDVLKPKEIDALEIGDRGTESEALYDHKAFLFSKSKNLLVIPITLAEIDKEKYPSGISANTYGDFVWQGAYALSISPEDGIEIRGRVAHEEDSEVFLKSGYRYYKYDTRVRRSLYMDDVLYTISASKIKMNDLDDMEEINEVELPYEEERDYIIY